MEKIFTIRAVAQDNDTELWFERLHHIRTAHQSVAEKWVREDTARANRRLELIRVENIRSVPHFGRQVTDE